MTIALPRFEVAPAAAALMHGFREALSGAEIVVFDSASANGNHDTAGWAGSRDVKERRAEAGNVLRRILRSIDANVLVVMDGNAAYLASDVRAFVDDVVGNEAAVVVGAVWRTRFTPSTRFQLGSRLLRWFIALVLLDSHRDSLSGFFVIELGCRGGVNQG